MAVLSGVAAGSNGRSWGTTNDSNNAGLTAWTLTGTVIDAFGPLLLVAVSLSASVWHSWELGVLYQKLERWYPLPNNRPPKI